MEQADLPVLVKPGTDGALACAVMHCLFRDGKADWDYLDTYTDAPRELEAHLRSRDPDWASKITGAPVDTIEAFASLIGERKRAFFRLGYGFSRSRNGAANMHAASCIPAVTGAWQSGRRRRVPHQCRHLQARQDDDRRARRPRPFGAHARPVAHRRDPERRRDALLAGRRSRAMLVQNTNPLSVCPDQNTGQARLCARRPVRVRARAVHDRDREDGRRGAAGDDVPGARRRLSGGGHQYLILGPKLIEPPGECRNNHEVIAALAKRLGAEHRGFTMSPRELIDQMLQVSKRGTLAELEANRWIDCQPPFRKCAFPRRLRLAGRQVPLQARLAQRAVPQPL